MVSADILFRCFKSSATFYEHLDKMLHVCIYRLQAPSICQTMSWWCYNLGRVTRTTQAIVVNHISLYFNIDLTDCIHSINCYIPLNHTRFFVPPFKSVVPLNTDIVVPPGTTISFLVFHILQYTLPFGVDIILDPQKHIMPLCSSIYKCNPQFYLALQIY